MVSRPIYGLFSSVLPFCCAKAFGAKPQKSAEKMAKKVSLLIRMAKRLLLDFFDNGKAYAENEVPQPQVSLAFGLLNEKPRLFKPFTKSTSKPMR